MVLPRVVMERVPNQIDKQLVAKPEDSPFFKPFRSFPESIPAEEQLRLADAGGHAIASSVIPAFREFQAFFINDYLPACPPQVAAWQMPQGETMYAFFARRYTTTDLTPDQIHEIGLKEVARIRAQIGMIEGGA